MLAGASSRGDSIKRINSNNTNNWATQVLRGSPKTYLAEFGEKRIVLGANFGSGRLIALTLIIIGLVLVLLGYGGAFTFANCGPQSFSCVRIYTWDLFAALIGVAAILAGPSMLFRMLPRSKH